MTKESPTLPVAGLCALRFDTDAVVHRSANPLFAAGITLDGLHGNVSEEELNLVQLSTCRMTQEVRRRRRAGVFGPCFPQPQRLDECPASVE